MSHIVCCTSAKGPDRSGAGLSRKDSKEGDGERDRRTHYSHIGEGATKHGDSCVVMPMRGGDCLASHSTFIFRFKHSSPHASMPAIGLRRARRSPNVRVRRARPTRAGSATEAYRCAMIRPRRADVAAVRRDWARPSHPRTSAPRLGSAMPKSAHRDWGAPLRHLERDRAHPSHICTGTKRERSDGLTGTCT
jgi:hypothetical protein